ncbi:hypothetical protein A3H38_04070 [candidate division WOR-1 bacterium RIFCSPLOWO2_02_FULL_46_20]|uniref:Uncharacterized protein n=2 Tax=Saganbacteria TaxID=1703751 RepID=A0A1F4RHJ9_UNCSA|nr:MAG: hypothetical protein A3J44_01535 [candidate division WOR-1 bacterium RIFCSPHIGHO2_02_FULL_45_12]OGC07665.1 MAG: hypothetical protein A3H38_04070 [candidate division WOR-1 bacterium RIFCSPLOWO2_02_FULL_46_20]OGC08237.1 MAG: hypothetical protein A3F86_05620 [candidate division WOR-1 bacterium RIFCSPLOWO2_12_FULL_45_9]
MTQFSAVPGSTRAETRCYVLNHAAIIRKIVREERAVEIAIRFLKSEKPFSDLSAIKRLIHDYNSAVSGEELTGVLMVHRKHLPPDLTSQVGGDETFRRFCEIIGFCGGIALKTLGGGRLPSSLNDSEAARLTPVSGFPVTRPSGQGRIKLNVSYSFAEQELRDLLGAEFYPYAGKMIFLNILDDASPRVWAGIISAFVDLLQGDGSENIFSPTLH